ncbi:MAG: hypothetical protein KF799_10045 [Bdellovibrionales bacterium]|nr:hypothetical protein [Bdellovibrionales bacterium]
MIAILLTVLGMKAAWAERPVVNGGELTSEEESAEVICEHWQAALRAALVISKEKKIARVSGAYNLSDANEAGRVVVERMAQYRAALKADESAHKRKFNAAEGCYISRELSEEEAAEAVKVIQTLKKK